MATARTIINPRNAGSIKFAANAAAIPAGIEQGFQIIDFQVKPSPNLSAAAGTYGSPPTKVPGQSSWDVIVNFYQDWGTTDSLSEYLFTNDGTLQWFRIDPATAGVKGFEGPVFIVASLFAGSAEKGWIDTVTMPCQLKPTLLTAT